ncbi:MAG: TetR/AcrR family transcriptional regulator [Caulobacteraceae bacterium]|nr:TetR/AcrR family transcriptional regulator [Caulobacteraceae bacterium]
MPRLAGQVDRAKAEAMLVAASEVISERGFGAPVEAIAKRAGVSKQTLYNHYGGKAGLIRALIRRRVEQMTAPLADERAEPQPEAALTAFAIGLMETVLSPTNIALTRVAIQGAADMPDIAQAMHEAGAVATRQRLAAFLEAETAAGRLCVDDAAEAAEFFSGMVGARQLRGLLGLEIEADRATVERLSASIARRFVRAYGPRRRSAGT